MKKKDMSPLLGIPYHYGAGPFSEFRPLSSHLPEVRNNGSANCQRLLQLAFFYLMEMELTREQILLPHSMTTQGRLVFKGEGVHINWNLILPGDVFFLNRLYCPLRIAIATKPEHRWHCMMYIGFNNVDLAQVFLHSSYCMGRDDDNIPKSTLSRWQEILKHYDEMNIVIRRFQETIDLD